MLLDRMADTGSRPRVGNAQVITVAQLLGRESGTTVRIPVPAPEPVADSGRSGSWVNKATVATAVVTFGSVLAVGSTFLPHGHGSGEPDAGPSPEIPITEALSAAPPSAAPVTRAGPPAATRPGAPPAIQSGPSAPAPHAASQAPARHAAPAPPAPAPHAAPPAPARHAAPPGSAARQPAPGANAGPAKSSKPGKSGSGKPGAHRASAQRPATLSKASSSASSKTPGKASSKTSNKNPAVPSARASAPGGGVGGAVSGLTGGLL